MDPGFSPEEWRDYLLPKLDEQMEKVKNYQDYYDGAHRLAFATAKFQESFAKYFPPIANNWMKLVVDTPVSRLDVQGFRFATDDADTLDNDSGKSITPNYDDQTGELLPGKTPAPKFDPQTGTPLPPPKPGAPVKISGETPPWELEADQKSWDYWQASNMDSQSILLHTDAVKLGVTYINVVPAEPGSRWKMPRIVPEHPSQVYVEHDPEDHTNRLAAVKRWISPYDGFVYCDLYLPGKKYRYVSDNKSRMDGSTKYEWKPRTDKSADPEETIAGGVVPMVALENRPDVLTGPHSDLEDAIGLQDMVNKLVLDMMVTAEFHAFPQRWATGWDRAVDNSGRELSNREVEVYFAQSRVVRAESEDTEFGQFAQANMENYLAPIEMLIEHLAAQTQTPLYYLKVKTGTVSADAMHAMDQGLVDRCKLKLKSFSDAWEEVLRVCFLMDGDEQRGNAQTAEVIWGKVESQSMAVLMQAAVMGRQSLSLPIEVCWEMLGYSPPAIRMMRDLMGLPPGGPVAQKSAEPMPGLDGNQMQTGNDPNAHPGNQPGQPSGMAFQGSPSEKE